MPGSLHAKCASGEVLKGGGFGFEGGDGFDETSNREGVADATRAADQAEHTAFTGQLDGNANECGDARTVDLDNAVQNDDDFLHARIGNGLQGAVELIGGFADREAAVNVENRDSAR